MSETETSIHKSPEPGRYAIDRVGGETRFPADLYDAPREQDRCIHFLGTSVWRVWPVLWYAAGVEVDADNEAEAKLKGANVLGELVRDVRCRKLRGERLQSSRRA